MTLSEMIRSGSKIQELSEHLNALAPDQRRSQTLELDGHCQKILYEISGDGPPAGLEHFVPAGIPEGREVIHSGRNSQPAFRYFEKRWCRPTGHPEQLWGYNETSVRPFIGPGYFVAHPTADSGSDPRGAVVVDYFMEPEGPVPDHWPRIKPNSSGLQMFVYNKTRDYMRLVSKHVSIGVAYRMEKRLMGYFVLCREDKA
ncbi:MAG: hypothetical protein OSB70_11575 [Myxococcota bacterium]|nr:hypothetical protein [Myxococcota bacterium]